MDQSRFETIASDPHRTQAEIESMYRNALEKGETECAAIARGILDSRFPKASKRGGSSIPTTVRFRHDTRTFASGKDAYLWLAQAFLSSRDDALDRYLSLHQRGGKRRGGYRFARRPNDLFPNDSKHQCNTAHYSKLATGCYAYTNLNNSDKFAQLIQLSYASGLEFPDDWEFQPETATNDLNERKEMVALGRKLLDELFGTETAS
ncbi:hypothetical protein G3580_09410 [Nitrogeniibacter mangrovi]|uniref:Uncharacterized protein n=1 Tax=Nitrogeniibacter mangrovi TaxID=2016596 RepID=A0A6C1B4B3_9RHOO|nr:hypothetical protein [Nitrogeniibacter mangrovi]QID17839.1 hypothetical protein G3580_09410 [Nitrogeniibacter mangrovi]